SAIALSRRRATGGMSAPNGSVPGHSGPAARAMLEVDTSIRLKKKIRFTETTRASHPPRTPSISRLFGERCVDLLDHDRGIGRQRFRFRPEEPSRSARGEEQRLLR